jgi:hypothetical protein
VGLTAVDEKMILMMYNRKIVGIFPIQANVPE